MKRKGTQVVRGRFAKPVGRSRREGSNPSPSSIRRRLAQLRRAPVLHAGGRRFDFFIAYQIFTRHGVAGCDRTSDKRVSIVRFDDAGPRLTGVGVWVSTAFL